MTTAAAICRSCHAPISWGESANGKRTPYDVVDGKPTTVSHFATCPDRDQWRSNGSATSAPASAAASPSTSTDRIAVRLRVLEIAAATVGQFAQTREDVRTAHILPLADRLLAWVEQAAPR
jgi:hypothetical protein